MFHAATFSLSFFEGRHSESRGRASDAVENIHPNNLARRLDLSSELAADRHGKNTVSRRGLSRKIKSKTVDFCIKGFIL
jgi:hypothetical protein